MEVGGNFFWRNLKMYIKNYYGYSMHCTYEEVHIMENEKYSRRAEADNFLHGVPVSYLRGHEYSGGCYPDHSVEASGEAVGHGEDHLHGRPTGTGGSLDG
jgi:hypothetical protein